MQHQEVVFIPNMQASLVQYEKIISFIAPHQEAKKAKSHDQIN